SAERPRFRPCSGRFVAARGAGTSSGLGTCAFAVRRFTAARGGPTVLGMGRIRVLAGISVAIAAVAVGVAPAAAAYAGGTPAPSPTGGSEYGAALARVHPVKPVARIFTVNPRIVVSPRLPRLRVRVDQPGARSVHARLVFTPIGES